MLVIRFTDFVFSTFCNHEFSEEDKVAESNWPTLLVTKLPVLFPVIKGWSVLINWLNNSNEATWFISAVLSSWNLVFKYSVAIGSDFNGLSNGN